MQVLPSSEILSWQGSTDEGGKALSPHVYSQTHIPLSDSFSFLLLEYNSLKIW